MRAEPATLIQSSAPTRREDALHELAHVPEAHREAAEVVRSHLVELRGGAPFLSPADALLLVRWLDDGVALTDVLAALDRCAVSRRRSRARTRFTLTAAKRHLYKPPLEAPLLAAEPGDHPFAPLCARLDTLPDPDAAALASQLGALPADAVVDAVRLSDAALAARWQAMGDEERSRRRAAAIAELGDIANLVDEATLNDLADEVARQALRNDWPPLDTATFCALAGAGR